MKKIKSIYRQPLSISSFKKPFGNGMKAMKQSLNGWFFFLRWSFGMHADKSVDHWLNDDKLLTISLHDI